MANGIRIGTAMIRQSLYIAGVFTLMTFIGACPTKAAELKVIATNNLKGILTGLAHDFERATGHRVVVTFDTGGALNRRILAGEQFDLAINQRPSLEQLSERSRIEPKSIVDFAKSSIDVVVRQGTPLPDISTPAAFKAALLKARSVAYTDPASGGLVGTYFARLLQRLGIAQELHDKTTLVPPPGAAVGELVAAGGAEIGINQKSELMAVQGITFVGELPDELSMTIIVSGAIVGGSHEGQTSAELLAYLASPVMAPHLRAGGLQSLTRN